MNTEEILKRVEELIETPFVTAQFGDNWKQHAKIHYNKNDVIEIAWKQGRKAILLERAIRQILGEYPVANLRNP